MMKHVKNGFTLIEIIVVAVLMAILALGVFSLFMMYQNAARTTAANLRIQRQSEMFLEEVARQVRSANVILTDVEDFDNFKHDWFSPDFDILANPDAHTIILYNNRDTLLYGFRFNNNRVEECPGPNINCNQNSNNWRPFTVGGEQIQLNPAGRNVFNVNEGRNEVEVNINALANGEPFNITGGITRCRIGFSAN